MFDTITDLLTGTPDIALGGALRAAVTASSVYPFIPQQAVDSAKRCW
jgi:hypothetical protein